MMFRRCWPILVLLAAAGCGGSRAEAMRRFEEAAGRLNAEQHEMTQLAGRQAEMQADHQRWLRVETEALAKRVLESDKSLSDDEVRQRAEEMFKSDPELRAQLESHLKQESELQQAIDAQQQRVKQAEAAKAEAANHLR